eukprot:7828008-Lingulodinium_polyedra.AAC.1
MPISPNPRSPRWAHPVRGRRQAVAPADAPSAGPAAARCPALPGSSCASVLEVRRHEEGARP